MIEFQYFNGCPNADKTLINLKETLKKDEFKGIILEIIEVPDIDTSKKINFQGSPSILVNGLDIYTGIIPTESSYSCRIYNINGENSGILPRDFIEQRVRYLLFE